MHGPVLFIDTQLVMMGKLLFAAALGGLIGTERAVLARQSAGTRTFALVSLGACLFTVVGSFVDTAYLGVLSFDPLHLEMGIITGIGFIGGGLMIHQGSTVHGITTAASLWIAAAIGMGVGFGLYTVTLFATTLALLVLTVMWYIEQRFKHWFESHNNNVV